MAMFIHTLKFKHYISATTATYAYQASFPWMGYFFIKLIIILYQQYDLFILATVGMILNNSILSPRKLPLFHFYQVGLMIFFVYTLNIGLTSDIGVISNSFPRQLGANITI
jgi:hypothetical protein